jgi:hypothetical protein
MSIENTGTAGAEPGQTAPAELQNANGQIASDGASVDASSGDQTADAPDQESATPEHRKASYRFSEMSRQIRDLQLELAKREGMLSALGRQQSAPGYGQQNAPAQPQAQSAPTPQPPNPADYPEGQYDQRFIEALADYRAETKIRAVLDETAKRQAEAFQKEAAQRAFTQNQERFVGVYQAAQEAGATGAARVLEIVDQNDRHAADLLASTTHPVETAEWLADNQDWLRAIAQARDPVQKALLVGRVDQHIASHLASQRAQTSARATTPAQTTVATQSNPAPGASSVAQPTVRSGTGGAPFNPASASFEAYEAWRKANPHG